jgi:hypothetical protein
LAPMSDAAKLPDALVLLERVDDDAFGVWSE